MPGHGNVPDEHEVTPPPTTTSTHSTAARQQRKEGGDEGYNSGDERPIYIDANKEHDFGVMLKEKYGWYIKRMAEDGNCLFRAVADQVFGDAEMHDEVRRRTMDYMEAERDHYSQFIAEDFDTYIARKRQLRVHGNHTEIQAMCEMYNRPVEVYSYSVEPLNTYHGQYESTDAPIRLSYHRREHYNSIVDPAAATIGVGLGLPNFEPGLADKNLIEKAKEESEMEAVEADLYEAAVMDEVLAESAREADAIPLWARQDTPMDDGDTEEAILRAIQEQSLQEYQAVAVADTEIEDAILEESRREYFEQLRRMQHGN